MSLSSPCLGHAELGVITFFASSHPTESCGSNGLPLTPNSIKILGQAQRLKTVSCLHLCSYLDIIRGKHERIMIASEYYRLNLRRALKFGKFKEPAHILQLAYEILQGLVYLNEMGIVHHSLSPDNILIDQKGRVKLFNYGLYYMTEGGSTVAFPIGCPKYMAPEDMADIPHSVDHPHSGPKSDVWSLGLIIAELIFGHELWSGLKLPQLFRKVLSLMQCDGSVMLRIAGEHNILEEVNDILPSVRDFLDSCLLVSPSFRPSPRELLNHPVFADYNLKLICNPRPVHICFPSVELHSRSIKVPAMSDVIFEDNAGSVWLEDYPKMRSIEERYDDMNVTGKIEGTFTNHDHLGDRSMVEVYYLWKLTGGDVEAELKKQGLIKSKPSICSLPNVTLVEGEMFGKKKDRALLLDNTVVVLSLKQLRSRLRNIPLEAYYPLTESEMDTLPHGQNSFDLGETATLPLIIREKDVEYQFHRVVLYERLLKGYPYKRNAIWKEAQIDIPPLYRSYIWAALLDIKGNVQTQYDAIDKETPTPTDRQIEVDIPRCHQYDELLASPTGHRKFKRILKAWIVSYPQYVYWQGLDSLCAPFLYLNFNDEALAYACLSAFISKYLHNFFLKDNSAVIHEYLAKFSQLVTFHDPELNNHLDSIGFIPELYAIPWFLTMFSHVFPCHRIFHLWDKMILGNSSFPLCVGLAILQQLRDTLLGSGFNECILLFSDLPEIDIDRCVQDSVEIFCSTPKSATYRQHEPPPKKTKKTDLLPFGATQESERKSALGMDPISLAELKSEKCPRISAEDLLNLLDLKRTKYSKPKILVVSVRSPEDFVRGAIQNSINIPFMTAFSPDGTLNPSPEVDTLYSCQGKIIVVVGGKGNHAVHFAESLVRLGFPRVCTLHKGIEVLRSTGMLIVPSSV